MKEFLNKVVIAELLFVTLIVGVYYLIHWQSERTNSFGEGDCLFVWGDSQMFMGLDVSLLSDRLNKQVWTSAEQGSGVYDFLVSEHYVPDSSVIIVSFPENSLLRKPELDYNRKGMEIHCLYELYKEGCPFSECMRIERLNRRIKQKRVFNSTHKLYPYQEFILCNKPRSHWQSMFEEEDNWQLWKAKAYVSGVQHLFDKHSQIVLVQFPFNGLVEKIAYGSVNRSRTDSLKNTLVENYAMEYDTVVLHSDSVLMHDLTHMNEVGARLLANKIADILEEDRFHNHFLFVRIE